MQSLEGKAELCLDHTNIISQPVTYGAAGQNRYNSDLFINFNFTERSMKILLSAGIFGLLLSNFAFAKTAYDLDTSSSTFKWHGKKVSGEHFGNIKFKSGSVTLDKGVPVGGEFTLDMKTITNSDVESAEWRKKLEDHLKSDDFFAVEKHSTAVFTINSAKAATAAGEFEINGTLKVKDISKPVKFVAKISEAKDAAKASAKFQINRLEWDIRYNSGKFFDVKQLGDKMIYDDIGIEFELSAKPAAAKKS
jgi:polyisoprenoid-binding protein YceI